MKAGRRARRISLRLMPPVTDSQNCWKKVWSRQYPCTRHQYRFKWKPGGSTASSATYGTHARTTRLWSECVLPIREFGFKIPCLVRSDGEVVDGHRRLKAARKLGITD